MGFGAEQVRELRLNTRTLKATEWGLLPNSSNEVGL
jgi:hypothetical protein